MTPHFLVYKILKCDADNRCPKNFKTVFGNKMWPHYEFACANGKTHDDNANADSL
jgi:hypothetical protein